MTQRGRTDVLREIEASGVVAVVRLREAAQMQAVADALLAGGVRVIEVTMTVPRAVELIARLTETLQADAVIGAGTVLDALTTMLVIDAGAEFVVSPVFRPELIEVCHRNNVAAMPGCFTPTEILSAWEAGADVVKVFPATALGPSFFKDLRGPLPHIRMMPTGGVTRANAGDWIRAGAIAIGVGTALIEQTAVEEGHFHLITENARHFIQAVQHARGLIAAGA